MQENLIKEIIHVDLSGNGTLVDLERIYHNHVFSRKDRFKIKETFITFMKIKLAEYLENEKEGKTQIELFDLGFSYLNKYLDFNDGYSTTLSYEHIISVNPIFFTDFGAEWFLFINPSFYKPKTKNGLTPSEIKLGIKFIMCVSIRIIYQTHILDYALRNREHYENVYLKVFKKLITEEERPLKMFLTYSIYRDISRELDFDKISNGYKLRNSVLVRKICAEEKNIFEKFKEYKTADFLEFFDEKNDLITNEFSKEKLTTLISYIIENFKAESFLDLDYK